MTTSVEPPAFLVELGEELARVAREDALRRRPRRRPARARSLVLAAFASLVLVAGAGAATGLVPLPGGGGPAFVAHDATGRFSPQLTSRLSALARPRTAADSMGDAAAFVTGPDAPAPGSSLRVAVVAPPDGTAHATAAVLPVWLLPTSAGDVSMQVLPPGADGPASGFTADLGMVEQGHALMTVGGDVFGLAPDGVASVRVVLGDGTRVTLPVVGNVFGAHLDEPVRGVELVTP